MILYPKLKQTKRGIETEFFFCNSFDNKKQISEIINDFEELKIIVNFSFCKSNIIEHILKKTDLHEAQDKDDKINSFVVKKEYIKIYFTPQFVNVLCSYENKFLQDFNGFDNAIALEIEDREKTPSIAQDGKKQFIKSIARGNYFYNKTIFEQIFPQPEQEEFFYWKKAKKNVEAVFYCKAPGEYKNIYSYDIKSSFPARLYCQKFPKHNGIYFEGEEKIPSEKWYIKKIRITACKSIYFDFYHLEEDFVKNGNFTTYITKETEEIIHSIYNIQYRTIDGYFYQTQKSIFNNFFETCIFSDLNKNKSFKKRNKGKSNALIGTFGANDTFPVYSYQLKGEELRATITTETNKKKAFYPVYLYVNGAAKAEIIKTLVKIWDFVIYANTDGFFTTKPFNFAATNSKYKNKIGRIEFRDVYFNIVIKEISNYCGLSVDTETGVISADFRLSGKRFNPPKNPVEIYNNFVNGFTTTIFNFSEYGFIQAYEFQELSLSDFIEEQNYIKQIELAEKLHAFYITSKTGSKIVLQELERNEKTKQALQDIFERLASPEVKENEKRKIENDIFKLEIDKNAQDYETYICLNEFVVKSGHYKKYDVIDVSQLTAAEQKRLKEKSFIRKISNSIL